MKPSKRFVPDPEPDAIAQPHLDIATQKFAMKLSFAVGVLMLFGKVGAWWLTGSTAILSDAAESIVHVAAVAFALFSMWLSLRPHDESHRYGHDKIAFFSAGFEGAMIIIAAIYIIVSAVLALIHGVRIENLGAGTLLIAASVAINAALGFYLLHRGRRAHSLILVANGRHILTDCYTSGGVILGLLLARGTGILAFDPLIAILLALNILHTGGKLIRESIGGLMDEADPATGARIEAELTRLATAQGIRFHNLRFRNAGNTLWVEVHLLFAQGTPIEVAHRQATGIEAAIEHEIPGRVVVNTHLEAIEDHAEVHAVKIG
jgi:cation diffusion facilitator family transporter